MTVWQRVLPGVAAWWLMVAGPAEASPPGGGFDCFVTARGDRLYEGERPLRFVSWNIPNLLTIEDNFDFLGASPWRWPDEFEIADALESVRQFGGRVARTYVITVRRTGSDMGDCVHVLGPGKFNEEAFVALDRVLQIANQKQVRIILPLVDNWHWMGGVEQYAAFRGKKPEEFWTDRQLIDDFKATVRHVVERRNTITGRLYRDDKAILGWETGNEIDATPEWTTEIAAYIKQLDRNHLVIDGCSLRGVPLPSLDDPNVDVITTHHYPGPGRDLVSEIVTAIAQTSDRKPYFVGEFGFIPVDEAARACDAVIDGGASGALLWSLRFHRREGGFYWHDEPSGGNLFKAYHWPGFPSGDSYQERAMLTMLGAAARRIGARETPALTPPAAARLLPIEHPGRITWQGSAGASGYDVQRSEQADGPWKVVAAHVSDAACPYRPLYADESITPGTDYFYRVVARGVAGAAAPSNIVGPVAAENVLLVDELQDESRLARRAGPVSRCDDRARRAQEDLHRLQLAPGGQIEYAAPGDVQSVTAFLFVEKDPAAWELSVSVDGQKFTALPMRVTAPARAGGDYHYLKPVLVTAAVTQPGVRCVRIANPANSAAPWQLSRVEIEHQGTRRRSPSAYEEVK